MSPGRHLGSVSTRRRERPAGRNQSSTVLSALSFSTLAAAPRLARLCDWVRIDSGSTSDRNGLRDGGQQALISRFAGNLSINYVQNREVPFPNVHDLRSWDMVLRLGDYLIGVEAETRVRDIQELVRRVRQRERYTRASTKSSSVLSDSAHNRALAGQLREALGQEYGIAPATLLNSAAVRPAPTGIGSHPLSDRRGGRDR